LRANAIPRSTAGQGTEPAPVIASNRLVAAFSYDKGMVGLAPAAASQTPALTGARAYAAFQASGLYSTASSYSTPEIFFALYTNYGQGTATGTGLTATHVREPVWVVRFANVPDSASGAGSAAGSSATTGSAEVLHDIVAIIDDASGTLQDVYSDLPDPQPIDSPAPATRDANGK
jgi:hypothetical protein